MRSGFQISTNVQVTAISEIISCIDKMGKTDPRSAVLQQVVAKQQNLGFFQYGEGEENAYLGAQYEYTSKKNGKITYFVGVKGGKFCIGIVADELVAESEGQDEDKAIGNL